MATREAASLIYSTDALRERATKAGLTQEEVAAIVNNNVDSLARLAFAIAPPGKTPEDDAIRNFFAGVVPVNLGTLTATKLLIFEAHTLVVANIKNEITRKDDISSAVTLPAAERARRIADQQARLTGLRFKGDEECAHSCYDLVFTMMEKDSLVYLHLEKFATRRAELQQKKPPKEIILDNTLLSVKEKSLDMTCSTRTELELFQAFRRRALAFDLVGLCSYAVMNQYHSELIQHLQDDAPPGYSTVTLTQILRADRAAFLHMGESFTTLKRTTAGALPLQDALPNILTRPSVAFNLLPLQSHSSNSKTSTPTAKDAPKRKPEADPARPPVHKQPKGATKGKQKGKGKGRNKGPRVPKELIN